MAPTSYPRGVTGWFRSLPLTLKLVTVLVAVVIGFLVLVKLLSAFNYSTGTRTGTLDKLSSKGIACWTTEGQLALPAFSRPGTLRSREQAIDNTFYFSVPNADVRTQLEAIPPGSPVTLEYHQKLFALAWPIPFFCVRRTQYEIVGVKPAPAYQPTTPMRP